MKSNRVIPLSLVLFVIAVICLNSCDENCDPCDVACPDPAADLIGLWITFEAFSNGTLEPGAVGLEFDFRANDTLIIEGDTINWYATDDRIIMANIDYIGSFVLEYYFEADTLDMSGVVMTDTLRWRLLREEDMPTP
jgi:hypothetical protein